MDSNKSSLPYQLVLSLSKCFVPAFIVLQTVLFLLKVIIFPYPYGNIACEALLLLLFGIIEYGRILSGERGNLTEKGLFVMVSLMLSGPACAVLTYWLLWQTYIFRLEAVVVITALGMQALQGMLAIVLALNLARKTT